MSDTNLNDASFTPEIQDSEESTNKQTYSATGSFRFWCQKVLPLVYDDSLSYYELLCKVVNYLNSVIQNVDNLNTSVDNTNTAFNNLQNYVNATKDTLVEVYGELEQYVNEYFNNLDVQEEINSKLDSMAEDGSLSTIISPFIPTAVSDWLSNNITPTSPAIDASLSVSGAGADAKVTGDFIHANNDRIDKQYNMTERTNVMDLCGMFDPATVTNNGVTFTNNNDGTYTIAGTTLSDASSHMEMYRGALPYGVKEGDTLYIICDSPSNKTKFSIYCYDANNTRLTGAWITDRGYITIPQGTALLLVWLMVEERNYTINETIYPQLLTHDFNVLEDAIIRRNATKYLETENSTQFYNIDAILEPGMYLLSTSIPKRTAPTDENGNTVPVNALLVEKYGTIPYFYKQTIFNITAGNTDVSIDSTYVRYNSSNTWSAFKRETTLKTADLRDLLYSIIHYNYFDIFRKYVPTSGTTTSDGVTMTWNSDHSCTITGKKGTNDYIYDEIYRGALPANFIKGEKIDLLFNSESQKVTFAIYFWDSEWNSKTRVAYFVTKDTSITIPDMAENLIVRIAIEGNYASTVFDETVTPTIVTHGLAQVIQNNTFNYEVHRDTYNVTSTPTISLLSDYILAATGDTSDRTNDIMTMLQTNKVCRLGTGDYYIRTGISMPDGTSIIGSGRGTRIILDDSVINGFAISVGSYCSVQDLTVTGKANGNLPYEEYEIGTRDGIVQIGDYVDFNTPATFSANFDKLSNLWVENFTGSGIKSYRNDGAASFLAENIDILRCGVGVNIAMFSEFHSWENIRTRWCVYACIMNGGNNLFTNCHFDTCIHGIVVDNSLENLVNDTHSSFVNCTMCHENNNTGNAIEVIGVNNGLVFSNCQIFYSKIVIRNSSGVVITNFNFGSGESIILENANGINISNCIFGTTPTIIKSNVSGLMFKNNMTRAGVGIV